MLNNETKKFINEIAIGCMDEIKELVTNYVPPHNDQIAELIDTIEYLAIKIQELKEVIQFRSENGSSESMD